MPPFLEATVPPKAEGMAEVIAFVFDALLPFWLVRMALPEYENCASLTSEPLRVEVNLAIALREGCAQELSIAGNGSSPHRPCPLEARFGAVLFQWSWV